MIYDSRNAALHNDHEVNVLDIRRRAARDFIKQVQLRLATKKDCGILRIESILSDEVDRMNASVSDFYDIATW